MAQEEQQQQSSQKDQPAVAPRSHQEKGSRRRESGQDSSWGSSREQISHDARALADSLQGAATSIEEALEQQLRQRPYGTLAIAAGAGYLIGGGLATRINRMAFALAGRIFVGIVAREIAIHFDAVRDQPHGRSIA